MGMEVTESYGKCGKYGKYGRCVVTESMGGSHGKYRNINIT